MHLAPCPRRLAAALALTAASVVATAAPAPAAWTQEHSAGYDLAAASYPRSATTTMVVSESSPVAGTRLCVVTRLGHGAAGASLRFVVEVRRPVADRRGADPVTVAKTRSRRLPLAGNFARACLAPGPVLAGDSIHILTRLFGVAGELGGDRPRLYTSARLEPVFDTGSSVALASVSLPLGSDLVRTERVTVSIDYVCTERRGCRVGLEPRGAYGWRSAGFGWSGGPVFHGSGTTRLASHCNFAGLRSEQLRLTIMRRNEDVLAEQLIDGGWTCVDD